MSYRVEVPARVKIQIVDAALFISEESPDRAFAWHESVYRRLETLKDLPMAYRVVADRDSSTPLRKMTIGSYLAFFRVDESTHTVTIESFRHGARRPQGGP